MKHEVISMNTKKTLAASLKKFMMSKPLSKISVSEIIADCGVKWKTFYYHFEDIYALLKWMLEQEVIEVVKKFDLFLNPEEAIAFVMNYVDANHHILNCAYDSMGRDGMKRFFYADFTDMIRTIINKVEIGTGISTDESFKQTVCAFYTEALAGMLIDYFQYKGKYDREELIHSVLLILQVSIPNILIAKSNE